MTNQPLFRGLYTAIVTPFREGKLGSTILDMPAYERIVRTNLNYGVDGIVVCGTTGESPTLSTRERSRLIGNTISISDGKPVIVGTGSNSTRETIEMSRKAEDLGASGLLVVTPYYNRPTQEGLFRHFKEIARETNLPIILYDVPKRTGSEIAVETLCRLVEDRDCRNIIGIKDASGSNLRTSDLIREARAIRADFAVYSGDDKRTVEVMWAGGDGVISVASNIIPRSMSEMVQACLDKKWDFAEGTAHKLEKIFDALACDTNPIPIKRMLSAKGFCKEIYRLPLCELSDANKELVDRVADTLRPVGL